VDQGKFSVRTNELTRTNDTTRANGLTRTKLVSEGATAVCVKGNHGSSLSWLDAFVPIPT
jgi:hypothetical protein